MTGADDEDYESDNFRPAPHPDDRLWRHPAEMAAMAAMAAHAGADTARVPVVQFHSKHRPHVGLLVAAGIVVVGTTALTLGVLSARSEPGTTAAKAAPIANAEPIHVVAEPINEVAFGIADGENILAARVHDQAATSLPRIQAATAAGMREGSGLFITDDGYIATSAGLVDNAEYVLAWTNDGRRWEASVVASDTFSDVAVLHIDSLEWPAIDLGSDESLWAGQYALAFDHQRRTMAIGEVTSVSAAVAIETDQMSPRVLVDQTAALPGSAILDDTGEVIAMKNAGGTGAFATPAWMLERVAHDLIATGATTHAWLGLSADTSIDRHVAVVRDVTQGSPADHAGLRVGDMIDEANGEPIQSAEALWKSVQLSAPGDELVLAVTRHDNRRLITATVGELESPAPNRQSESRHAEAQQTDEQHADELISSELGD